MKKVIFVFLFVVAFFLAPESALAQENTPGDAQCIEALGTVRTSVNALDDSYARGTPFQFSVPTEVFSLMAANCGPTGSIIEFQATLIEDNEPVTTDFLRTSSDQISHTEIVAGEAAPPSYYRMDLYARVCNGSNCTTIDIMSHSFCFSDTGSSCDDDDQLDPLERRSTNICNQVPQADRPACCSCVTGTPGCINESSSENEVKAIWTAIGCISTNPTSMIGAVMRVGLSIAGGVTILVILAAGFLFSTSQGDPKRTSDAKDMMTSAVVGLLFIIFSVTILQFIGVDVLKIPGFGGA